MTKAVLSAAIRPLVEPRLPDWVEPLWFSSKEQALNVPQAEIGWFDLNEKEPMIEIERAATGLKWMNPIYAGLDFMPLDLLAERGVVVTNGVGINAITIAEYVVMLMLAHAKGYREVVRAQDRNEWLLDSPGKRELAGERVLLLGMGAIGSLIKTRLEAFDMKVVPVRRSGADGALKPGEWRGRLGEFDWVVLAVPSTPETRHMIGAMELAAMRPNGVLVNIARGDVVDQAALVEALEKNTSKRHCSMSPTPNRCPRITRCGASKMRRSPCTCRAARKPRCSSAVPIALSKTWPAGMRANRWSRSSISNSATDSGARA